jgi:O-antigen/teichoic acid export membrane protein
VEELKVPNDQPAWRILMRRFVALAGGESGARLLGFVAVTFMARRLSPEGFGLVVLGTTLVTWFRIVMDSGTEVLGVRDVARDPRRFREIAQPILGLRLALSIAAGGLLAGTIALLPAAAADRQAALLFALVLPVVALNLRFMVLGVGKAKAIAVGNIASQAVVVAGVFIFVQSRHDLIVIPAVIAVGELLYAIVVLGALVRRFGFVRPQINLTGWLDLLRSGFPITINNIARAALYSFDLLLIGFVLTRWHVGLYAAAYKPVLFGSGMVSLLSVSALTAYSAESSRGQRAALVRRTALHAGALTAIAALVLSLGAELFLTRLFGQAYGAAAPALAILAWTLPLLACTVPYGSVLIAANRQRRLMRNNLTAAAFNIAANFAVVPLVGIEGAAGVTLASLLIVLVLNQRDAVSLGLADPFVRLRPRGGQVPGGQLPQPQPESYPSRTG